MSVPSMLRLEALLRRPHGENLLPAEDLKFPGMVEFRAPGRSGVQELLSLQGALFSASAATTLAYARVFMMLMSFQQQHRWVATWAHAPPASTSSSSSVRRVSDVCAVHVCAVSQLERQHHDFHGEVQASASCPQLMFSSSRASAVRGARCKDQGDCHAASIGLRGQLYCHSLVRELCEGSGGRKDTQSSVKRSFVHMNLR